MEFNKDGAFLEREEAGKCESISHRTKIFLFCLFMIISLIGITGNSFSIFILSGKRRRRKILSDVYQYYIIALAIADNGMLLFTGVLRYAVVAWLYEANQLSWIYKVYLCKIHRFFMHTFHNASVWLLLVMTFDRFLAVCFPFVYKIIKKDSKHAKVVTVTVCVLSCLAATPFLAVGPVYAAPIDDRNESIFYVSLVTSRNDPDRQAQPITKDSFVSYFIEDYQGQVPSTIAYGKQPSASETFAGAADESSTGCSLTAYMSENTAYIINMIFHVTLAFLVPYFILLVLNIVIFRYLHCSGGENSLNNSRLRLNRKITVMMMTVCFTFIILWLPQVIILMTSPDAHSHNCGDNEVFVSLAALSGITNSSLNFFLYLMTMKKFRDVAWTCIQSNCNFRIFTASSSATSSGGISNGSQMISNRSRMPINRLDNDDITSIPGRSMLNMTKLTQNENPKQLTKSYLSLSTQL